MDPGVAFETKREYEFLMSAQSYWADVFDIRAIPPEEMLDISMTVGDYSAGIYSDPWVFPVEMLDKARPKDFRVNEVTRRARGSDLLNHDPQLPELGIEILCSLLKALRAAQVWKRLVERKSNASGQSCD